MKFANEETSEFLIWNTDTQDTTIYLIFEVQGGRTY